MRMKMLLAAIIAALLLGFMAYRDLRSGIHSGASMQKYGEQLEVGQGTDEMVALLDEIKDYQEGSWLRSSYRDLKDRVSLLLGANSHAQAARLMRIARNKLRDGDTEEAIAILEDIRGYARQSPLPPDKARKLAESTAIAYMRLGEQQNCLNNPHASVCIIPLNKKAIHQLREGSTKAAKIYEEELLKTDPADYASKWLLNIAHMTLGNYPEGVPAEHLIPLPGMIDNYDGPKFANAADTLGLVEQTISGSVVLEDFNGDDLLDIFVTEWDRFGGIKFYLRRRNGSFHDATQEAGLAGLAGGLNAIHGDYDNDGDADIYITRGAWQSKRGHVPNSLLRNNGDGSFTDVTVAAGVLGFHPTITSAFADLNNDGWLDLVVANEKSGTGEGAYSSQLYISNKDGTFTDRAADTGFAPDCGVKGLAVGDSDNDGDADIFVSCSHAPNKLFENRLDKPSGKLIFRDISEQSGSQMPLESFSSWFWDYDNDGDQDLFVASYGFGKNADGSAMGGGNDGKTTAAVAASYDGQKIPHSQPVLYRNEGDGSFSATTSAANLDRPFFAMGSNFGDFDNDGWLDIYLGTGAPSYKSIYPNAALQNIGGKSFRDISGSAGLGHIQKGHGIAFGDIDHDGDQDIFAEMGGAFSGDTFQNALFENLVGKNNWLKLFLVGTKSNRSAIGARIKVEVKTRQGGSRAIYRTVSSGSSFGSNPLRSEIGLGQAERITRVTVSWPASGIVQIFDGLALNTSYRIIEGKRAPQEMNLSPLPFKRAKNVRHKHG